MWYKHKTCTVHTLHMVNVCKYAKINISTSEQHTYLILNITVTWQSNHHSNRLENRLLHRTYVDTQHYGLVKCNFQYLHIQELHSTTPIKAHLIILAGHTQITWLATLIRQLLIHTNAKLSTSPLPPPTVPDPTSICNLTFCIYTSRITNYILLCSTLWNTGIHCGVKVHMRPLHWEAVRWFVVSYLLWTHTN